MNTGTPARVANALSAAAASSHQIPPPATTTGRSASASSRPSVSSAAGSAAPRGRWTYAVGIGASRSSSVVIRRSTGISTKTGPGRPERAVRIAVVRTSGICRVSATVNAPFVIGLSSATCSISCSAPSPRRPSGAAPPMSSIGLRAAKALATPVTASVTPGPGATIATPMPRVRRAYASVQCAAACSWRVSMTATPSSRQPS